MPEISNAERIAWQRRAATLLGRLLELAANEDLPSITWTVQAAGSSLSGQVLSHPASARRERFGAWQAAITRASGRAPDHAHEHKFSSGETRLVTGWEHLPVRLGASRDEFYPTVNVTLAASIWAAPCPSCGSEIRAERGYVPGATGTPVTCGDDWHDEED
jgi:hypothetical protein